MFTPSLRLQRSLPHFERQMGRFESGAMTEEGNLADLSEHRIDHVRA